MLIETARLTIEKAELADTPFILNLLNSPNWIQYIGDRGIKTSEDSANYITHNLIKSYDEHGYGLYKMCLKSDRKPIGLCGFLKRDYLENPDIGFAILPEYEGKGYTFEAAKATMEYGKSVLKMQSILAITTEDNSKSQNLLSKLGLSSIGKVKPNEGKSEFLLFSN